MMKKTTVDLDLAAVRGHGYVLPTVADNSFLDDVLAQVDEVLA
jgi:hypothetical protein